MRRRASQLLNFDRISGLTSEQLEFKQHIRTFCDAEIAPFAAQIDKEDKFPEGMFRKLGDYGLLGLTAPTEFGGLGLHYTEQCIAMEELSRASGSLALSWGAHDNLCVNQLVRFGTEAQKKKFLPKLASGEFIGALAMSESGAGSDVTSMTTKAEFDPVKKVFKLNGTKFWITNGPTADVIVVYAKTENKAGKHGISALLVEKQFKGFSIAQKLDKLGMRGSPTGELVFEDVEVPEENLLGELNKGVYVLMSGLDYERLVLSAGPLGLMEAAFELSAKYAVERKQFGKPIGDFQLIQAKLADMYMKMQSTRALLYTMAKQADQGHIDKNESAGLILTASDNAVDVALESIQILGGNGYINEYPTGRFLRDAKLYTIGAGTNEIRRWLIGRSLIEAYSK